MPYSVKGFFEINEDMVKILLMLEVLFTQDSKVEDFLTEDRLQIFFLGLAAVQYCIVSTTLIVVQF